MTLISLIPPIRSFALKRRAFFTISIFFNKEIISPYSYYTKKGLVYIAIISSSSRQPFSCLEYTKANTCLLCDIRLVFFNKLFFIAIYVFIRVIVF